uniref:Uncharacterized protein n=1 Tax=Anguilla anguilla TaxID=7936 RepID=A0A0E9XM61_ANGAN
MLVAGLPSFFSLRKEIRIVLCVPLYPPFCDPLAEIFQFHSCKSSLSGAYFPYLAAV